MAIQATFRENLDPAARDPTSIKKPRLRGHWGCSLDLLSLVRNLVRIVVDYATVSGRERDF